MCFCLTFAQGVHAGDPGVHPQAGRRERREDRVRGPGGRDDGPGRQAPLGGVPPGNEAQGQAGEGGGRMRGAEGAGVSETMCKSS